MDNADRKRRHEYLAKCYRDRAAKILADAKTDSDNLIRQAEDEEKEAVKVLDRK